MPSAPSATGAAGLEDELAAAPPGGPPARLAQMEIGKLKNCPDDHILRLKNTLTTTLTSSKKFHLVIC
jgi:hypothetical protein